MPPLSLQCPHCGGKIKPDQAFHEGAWADVAGFMARLGQISATAWEYVQMFRLPARGLPVERAARILAELVLLWEDGTYKFNGVFYRGVDKATIAEALKEVVNAPNVHPPLKNHNYLKKVLHPRAQKDAAEAERRTEEQRRHNRAYRDAREAAERENGPRNMVDLPPEVKELLDAGRAADAVTALAKINQDEKNG
jgi:hypothetical protein